MENIKRLEYNKKAMEMYHEQKKKSRKKKQYDPDETRKKFYNYYNECFKLKNVIETLEPAIKFLINETDVYLP